MICRNADAVPIEALPGITRRTLACGGDVMMVEFRLKKGVTLPLHSHPHEQVGYLVSGRIRIIVNGREEEMGPGDTYGVMPDEPHGAVALENSVVVDAFYPPREDYR